MTTKKRNKNQRISEFSNDELLKMDVIEVYKLLLEGRVTRFPMGIWDSPEAVKDSIKCTKYMIEEILHWNLDDIKSKIRVTTFKKYKLAGMLQKLYCNSPYAILSLVYPNSFHPWELHEAPNNFWDDENNILEAMDWLINTKLKWTREDIIEKYNNQVLVDNDLGGLLYEGGNASSFVLLDKFMPGEFYPWELKASSPPANYWRSKENRVFAIKNMIENILKWTKEDIKKNLTKEIFSKYSLDGLLQNYYNGSTYRALQEVYPNEFLPWELNVGKNFWDDKNNRINAVRWLFEIKLKWTKEDIKKNIKQKYFFENGLSSLVVKLKGGMTALILEAYPDIKEWELPVTSSNYWENRANRMKALDYLFREKLKWSNDDIKNKSNIKMFSENNMAGIKKYYKGSLFAIISDYLSEEDIKVWETCTTPVGFWDSDENCIDAINWLIKKENLNKDNVYKVSKKMMQQYKIFYLVKTKYNGSMNEFKENLLNFL